MLYEYLDLPPGKSLAIRATFSCTAAPDKATSQKLGRFPLEHFHPYQTESFCVESGTLITVVEGEKHVLTSKSEGLRIPKGACHLLVPDFSSGQDIVVSVTADEESSAGKYQLDRAFFENWSSYQSEALKYNFTLDILQVLAMWDAGDVVFPLPSWIPFNKTLARWRGVVLGRWIGGLLGYQPFYLEWTTDWELCCAKMKQSVFQRRFAKVHHQ